MRQGFWHTRAVLFSTTVANQNKYLNLQQYFDIQLKYFLEKKSIIFYKVGIFPYKKSNLLD